MTAALLALFALSLRPALAVDAPHPSDCSNCHSLHGGSYPKLLGNLCDACHFDGGPAPAVETHSSRTTDTSYGNWDLDCWACHNPHTQEQDNTWGTTYGKFLKVDLNAEVKEIDPTDPGPYYEAVSTLRTVSGTSIKHVSTTDFVDGDGNSDDDICQACHESTAYYNTGSELNYHPDYGTDTQPGGDCTQCHTHEGGFYPSCVVCHAHAQGASGERRQVVDAGGDFERASHHVTDGTTTEIVDDADCQVCHDQSWHQGNTDPEVYLYDPDGGASIAYDGTGASVESFCLHCHDATGPEAFDSDGDSSDGYQPFTDGRDAPDIDTTWTTSSHGTTTVAAVADEACLACHGGTDSTRTGVTADRDVHGSDEATLLSSTVNGVAVANVEEALCFACHDGATASTDIEGEFAKGTNGTDIYHHPVDDAEQSSGRTVECTDCHNPHAATGSDPVAGVAGIDLDGNAIPAGSPVEQYEVCFKCHGDDYNSSRSGTTNKRTDFDPTNSAYHPVTAAGRNESSNIAATLLGGLTTSSTIACTDCHNNEATADAEGVAANSASGPQGPHGSTNAYILRGAYEPSASGMGGMGGYSASNFELCGLCHDLTAIVETRYYSSGARTNFMDGTSNLHYRHLRMSQVTCGVCHNNMHSNENVGSTNYEVDGTLYTSPPPTAKTRLIAFDPSVVSAISGYSAPTWSVDTTTRERGCYLTCHMRLHSPKTYTPTYGDDDSLTIP